MFLVREVMEGDKVILDPNKLEKRVQQQEEKRRLIDKRAKKHVEKKKKDVTELF